MPWKYIKAALEPNLHRLKLEKVLKSCYTACSGSCSGSSCRRRCCCCCCCCCRLLIFLCPCVSNGCFVLSSSRRRCDELRAVQRGHPGRRIMEWSWCSRLKDAGSLVKLSLMASYGKD